MASKYNDAWILDHWKLFRNWKSLQEAYNSRFETNIGYSTFKSHCNRDLGLNFHYTEEETEWLKANYPILGRVKATAELNRLFGSNRTSAGVKKYCQSIGLKVTDERKKERAIENTGRYHEVGAIVEKGHGILFIKMQDGRWEQLHRTVLNKEIPQDCIVVFLDGDKRNFDKNNLAVVPRKYSAVMTKNRFWSEFSEITRTGLKWCELYYALGKDGRT